MKNKRKAFWHNFKFKYKLTITNENTLEEVVAIHVSKLNGVSVLLLTVTVIFLIAASIITFTPLRNYLPGYMNSEVREQVVSNALRADSLQEALNRQNLYITNIQDIFRGEVRIDTVHSIDSLTVARSEELMERSKQEEEFRKQYEEQERYNLTAANDAVASGIIFHRPTRGMISSKFDAHKKHYGIGYFGWDGNIVYLYGRNGLCHSDTAWTKSCVGIQTLWLFVEKGGRYSEGR